MSPLGEPVNRGARDSASATSSGDSVKLSVRVITYNHVRFVRDALDSILMQKVSFPFEIVVGDDGSSDGTREILLAYQRSHPRIIRLLLAERNMGGRHNFVRTFEACRGKYIALLDGDDYWTAPDKLEQQVSFLERHADYAICFHDALCVEEDGSRPACRFVGPSIPEDLSLADILVGDVMPPSSGVVLRSLTGKLPAWFQDVPAGDWPLYILSAKHGRIRYLRQVSSVYRRHAGGLTRKWNYFDYYVGTARMLGSIRTEFDTRFEPMIEAAISQLWRNAFFPDHRLVERDPTSTEIEEALAQWPGNFPLRAYQRRRLSGSVCARVASFRMRAGNRKHALRWLVAAIGRDPGWLRRWGFWSMALEACAGHSVAAWMRPRARRLLGDQVDNVDSP